jgi:hypothetical protein
MVCTSISPRLRVSAAVLIGAVSLFAFPGAAAPAPAKPAAPAPAVASTPVPAPMASPAPAAQDSAAPAYQGSAYDYERNVNAYREEHVERYRKGKHVSTHTAFLGADGKPIAERTLDFSRHDFNPDYLYKDLRNGYEEGAKVEGADILVHYRDNGKTERKEKRIQVPEPCIINGGVGEFVKSRWKEIAAGKKVGFNMVIPARLDFFRFEAYIDPKYALKPEEAKGRAYKPVVVEPKSSVLSMLLPVIVMYEDPATLRMVAYQGIVNVADPKGRSLRVRTTYPGIGP